MQRDAEAMNAVIEVRVVPNASKEGVAGRMGEAVRIRVRGPAVEGKANASLVEFLAERLDVRASAVRIVSGATSRLKRVAIEGIETAEALRRLGVAGGG